MTFTNDKRGPTVGGDGTDDALATRRYFLKRSGAVAAAGLGTGVAAGALPGTAFAARHRKWDGHEPASP